jgi:hypothetical protein
MTATDNVSLYKSEVTVPAAHGLFVKVAFASTMPPKVNSRHASRRVAAVAAVVQRHLCGLLARPKGSALGELEAAIQGDLNQGAKRTQYTAVRLGSV